VAERKRLTLGRPARFAILVALVVLVHSMTLDWLGDALQGPSPLKTMATPLFTRVLQPSEPPPVTAAAEPPAAMAPKRPTITSMPRKTAPKPKKAASAAAAAASAPESPVEPPASSPAPTAESEPQVAAAPQEAASAPAPPTPPASAAQAPASAPATARLDSWPSDTRLSYRLSGWFRGDLYGSASVQWQRENARYQNRIEISIPPFAWLNLTSQGEVTDRGLSPQAFEEQRRSSVRQVRLTDDEVVLNDGRRMARPADVQDTASQFVELAHRFATGREKLEVGHRIEVWLARPNGVDLWTYDIIDRQTLALRGMGTVEAYHLQPRPIANPRGNITAEIWFAPALQYLPVRIRINMGPDIYVELTAEKIEQK